MGINQGTIRELSANELEMVGGGLGVSGGVSITGLGGFLGGIGKTIGSLLSGAEGLLGSLGKTIGGLLGGLSV